VSAYNPNGALIQRFCRLVLCRNRAAPARRAFVSRAYNIFVLTSVHPPWYSCAKIFTGTQ